MGSSITSQNTHPLTVVVGKGETIRDRVGHLVEDARGDREFRFVKMRGGTTASQGMPVAAYRISAAGSEDTQYNVTAAKETSVHSFGRDMMGIVVAQSTVESGAHCYIITRGRLGKIKGHYPASIFALVSTSGNAVSGALVMSQGDTALRLFANATNSAGATITEYSRICGMALSTTTGAGTSIAGKLTRGAIRSPLLHGGGFGPIT